MRLAPTLALLLALRPGLAAADEAAIGHEHEHEHEGRHAVYVELFGKGGAYGIGYELALASRLSVGAAASFLVVSGERVTTVAPYLHATLASRGPHAWFAEAGPVVAHVAVPSPVPEWDGVSSTEVGGLVSSGYQVGGRVFLRASLSLAVGSGGASPWVGLAIGARP